MPRIVTEPDPARLAAVDAQCFAEPMDAAGFADWCAHPALHVWLLEDDTGAAVGLACFQQVMDEAEVYRIAVVPDRRGSGLGRWLLERLLAAVQGLGATRVHLEVRAGNVAARRLYARCGFREAGRRPGYYRAPVEDAVLYVREEAPEG